MAVLPSDACADQSPDDTNGDQHASLAHRDKCRCLYTSGNAANGRQGLCGENPPSRAFVTLTKVKVTDSIDGHPKKACQFTRDGGLHFPRYCAMDAEFVV